MTSFTTWRQQQITAASALFAKTRSATEAAPAAGASGTVSRTSSSDVPEPCGSKKNPSSKRVRTSRVVSEEGTRSRNSSGQSVSGLLISMSPAFSTKAEHMSCMDGTQCITQDHFGNQITPT